MVTKHLGLVGLIVVFIASLACSEEGPSKPLDQKEDFSKKLAELEARIEKEPDDPMLYYRKAQCLMNLTRYNEGYDIAYEAMKLFIKKNDDLAWMPLESVDLENIRVDIHFNMGPKERKHPASGIVRPLSFRVWKKGEDIELIEIIDFEISIFDNTPMTAALGKMMGEGHANFKMLETDAKYEDIRKMAIALIRKRHPKPQQADPPDKE